jgi:hypothetical protein
MYTRTYIPHWVHFLFSFPFFFLFSHKDKRGAIQCGWGYFVCVRPFVDPGRRSSSSRPYQGLTHIYISLVQDFLLLRVCCVERKKRNPAQRERVYCRLEVLFVASVHRATLCSLDGSPDISSSRQAVSKNGGVVRGYAPISSFLHIYI